MKRLIFLVVLLCLVMAGNVSAQNMSITDLGLLSQQTVQIYDYNGTLKGTYNTTTNDISLPYDDFTLVIKPTTADYLNNPVDLMNGFFDYVSSNPYPIILLVFLIGLLVKKW